MGRLNSQLPTLNSQLSPRLLILIGSILIMLGLGWFSGGPISSAFAQSADDPCPQGAVGPAFNLREGADTSKASEANVKALNFRLKCDFDLTKPKVGVVGVWRILLGAADIVIALYLVAIAIATIFHIQYDTYSIKKTLPPLIVGVILANFSLFIVRFLVDFATVLTATFINSEGGKSEFLTGVINGLYGGSARAIGEGLTQINDGLSALGVVGRVIGWVTGPIGGGLIWIAMTILGIIGIIIPALMLLVLGLLFYARYYVVLLLAAVSPLAFISMAFPPTQFFFKRWWSELLRWVFMLPVSFFLLWLAIRFTNLGADEANFASYFITLVFIYLAIKVPFSWGNLFGAQVTSKVYGLAKTAGAAAAGYGFGKLAYKIGDLRAKAGAKTQAANTLKGRAKEIQEQLKGRMPETHRLAGEYKSQSQQLYAQLKGARTTSEKDLVQLQLKDLKESYRRKMLEISPAERSRLESTVPRYLLKFKKSELLESAATQELRARKLEEQASASGTSPADTVRYRREAETRKKIAEQHRKAAEEKGLYEERGKTLKQAKGYESSGSRLSTISNALSYLHLPGMVEAVKTRYKLAGEFGAKELKKAHMYRTLAGRHFQQEAGYAAYESTRHFTPEQAAQFLDNQLLSKINRNIYNTPEKLSRLLRDLVAESPSRMLRYLRDNSVKGIGDFDFGAIQRAAENSLRYLSSGQPAIRDEFSRSLQRTPSIAGDTEVLSEYVKAGGAGGILPLRAGAQGWRTIAETVGRVVAQNMGKVADQSLTDQIMNLEVGRINVRDAIDASVLRTAHQTLLQPARENLRGVVSMNVNVGPRPEDREATINSQLRDIEQAINNVIRDRGSKIKDIAEIPEFKPGGALRGYVGDDGLPALKNYLNAAVARQKMAEVFVLKQNPTLASDRAEIIRTANNYVNSLGGGRR